MRSAIGRLTAIATVLILSACSGRAGTGSPGAGTIERRDPNVVTGDEMRAANYLTAFDALQALHPSWLRARGLDSFSNPSEVVVYFDAVKLGPPATLRNLDVRSIAFIRFYDGPSATSRWGGGHASGVIHVSTQR